MEYFRGKGNVVCTIAPKSSTKNMNNVHSERDRNLYERQTGVPCAILTTFPRYKFLSKCKIRKSILKIKKLRRMRRNPEADMEAWPQGEFGPPGCHREERWFWPKAPQGPNLPEW